MQNIAACGLFIRARGLFLIYISVFLAGCSAPRASNTPVVYDFGPGAMQTLATTRIAPLPPLELNTPQTSVALNSTAVLYRLAYADAQALKPYALARWSMPPAQLIGQRLRERLGQHRAVMAPGDMALAKPARATSAALVPAASAKPAQTEVVLSLRLDLEEFSQLFDSPDTSHGLLRLRATVTQRSVTGESLLGQRSFVILQNAPSPDASGGVRALTLATDQAVQEIEVWLGQLER